MQKHERESIEAVEGVLRGSSLVVTTSRNGKSKLTMEVTGLGGFRAHKVVSSSPKDVTHEVQHNRQWAQRILRDYRATRAD